MKHLHYSLTTLLHEARRTHKIGVSNPRLLYLGPPRRGEDDGIQIHSILHPSDQKEGHLREKTLQKQALEIEDDQSEENDEEKATTTTIDK